MNRSVCSKASNASSKMLEELANRSMTAKILRVEGSFNDQQMRVIWNALGLYISRNLRMGRGVNIPKFGIFTFTPPEVRLKGVTNENERDQKPRLPVFLIQKDFVKGLPLKTAVFYHQDFGMGLRPYTSMGTTGDIPITKMNIVEIASYANTDKDSAQLGVNRIIKYVSQKFLSRQNINIEIPNVGQLISRNNLVAVKFNEFLHRDTRTVLSKSLDERKKKGNMNLTVDNLKKFAIFSEMKSRLSHAPDQMLQIDDKTKDFLKTDFGFHFNSARNPMKNSLTEFSRTFATRQNHTNNNWLKTSQMSRMSNSGFYTSKVNSFSKQYNMALKLVRQWVLQHCEDAQNSFVDFVKLSDSKNQAMTADDVWSACRKICIDINQQQSQQLFRLLDANRDGFVTNDDWKKSISYDTNKLIRNTIDIVRKRKYKPSMALQKMGISGFSVVDVHTLRNGLQKLNEKLTDEQAIFLSRYITKGKTSVQIQNILQILQLADGGNCSVDEEWELRFLERLKKKMEQRNIYEEQLENKLSFYDRSNTGYIDQINFKDVLSECGVTLNLSQLAKLVKIYPLDSANKIDYRSFLDALNLASGSQNAPITYQQFVKVIKQTLFSQSQFPYYLPITVRKLTSELQATLFKNQQEKNILNFVRRMDVNKNDEVSIDDIKAYRQEIRDSKNYLPQHSCQVNMEDLLIKLREKSIKKRISFYDLFNKIDKNQDGFISRQQWMSNLDWILPISQDEKELLFDYMDSSQIKMIDYQTFLAYMNGNKSAAIKGETFDWVQNCLTKVKKWVQHSNMPSNKVFKLIDADGDSYISQKDIQQFLEDKLKYQRRQMSHVRLQKILKVMDSHKRGKIDEVDWQNFVNSQQVNWIADAQQQIGIILSKQYTSLSDAFYQITEGDNRLVYNAFKKWADSKKAFSGFIANQSTIKQFFAAIDTHKKGYLSENDFISAFGSYNWRSEQTKQFISKLKTKFNSAEEAYKVMNVYSKSSLNYDRFCRFVTELFGSRFKKIDMKNIWNNLVGLESSLSLNKFVKNYGGQWPSVDRSIDKVYPQDSWKYQDFSIIKGTTMRSFEHSYDETQKMEIQVRKIVNTIKQLLAASPKSLQQAFEKVDDEKTGKLNNIQFKKAIRSLTIALTSKQIDLLLNYCDYKVDTLINWRDFMKRFQLNCDEQKILQRIQPKMQLLSDLLHYYMVSPKDAFIKWNNPRTGYMNFEQFLKMLRELYHKAAQNLPEIAIIKQFYELIDVRKDGQLDYQQFTQIFRNYKPPSLVMGTVPATQDLLCRPETTTEPNKPIRHTEIPEFKNSPHYEQFVRFISRNRKYLQQKIQSQFGNSQRLIPYEQTSKIIQESASRSKLTFTNSVIRHCIAFSMTGDKVDYRLLLQNCKQRGDSMVEFPLTKVF